MAYSNRFIVSLVMNFVCLGLTELKPYWKKKSTRKYFKTQSIWIVTFDWLIVKSHKFNWWIRILSTFKIEKKNLFRCRDSKHQHFEESYILLSVTHVPSDIKAVSTQNIGIVYILLSATLSLNVSTLITNSIKNSPVFWCFRNIAVDKFV